MEQKYILESKRWIGSTFAHIQQLFKKEQLVDVELTDTDGKTIMCHSLILAASSAVLQNILSTVHSQEGVKKICIAEIKVADWQNILMFLYNGKMCSASDEIQGLKTLANSLQIRELEMLCDAVTKKSNLYKPINQTNQNISSCEVSERNMNEMMLNKRLVTALHATESNSAIDMNNISHDNVNDEQTNGLSENNNENDSNAHFPGHSNDEEHSYAKAVYQVAEYECTMCKRKFRYGHSLFAHEQFHRKNLPLSRNRNELQRKLASFSCRKCGKQCASKVSLSAHERAHRILPFKCNLCESQFHFQVNLDKHLMKEHNQSGNEELECSECGKRVPTYAMLRQHQAQTHKLLTNMKIKCNQCGKFVENLRLHNKVNHSTKKQIWSCDICGKVMKREKSLNDHMNIHTRQKPYKCSKCGASFAHHGSYYTHTKQHCPQLPERDKSNNMESCTCKVCGLMYSSLASLKLHMVKHNSAAETTSLKCAHCGEEFTRKSAYRCHMLSHKPRNTVHTCSFCKKTFYRKYDLTLHLRHHTQEKPFPCFMCHLRFSCLSNLYAHGRNMHQTDFKQRYHELKKTKLEAERMHIVDSSKEIIDVLELINDTQYDDSGEGINANEPSITDIDSYATDIIYDDFVLFENPENSKEQMTKEGVLNSENSTMENSASDFIKKEKEDNL